MEAPSAIGVAPRPLVLALGNDILGDDGVAFAAARALGAEFGGAVDIVMTGEAGLALVEFLAERERALLLDAMVTGRHPPGTVVVMTSGDFRRVLAPSPHYAGLPEVFDLAARLGLPMPDELIVLAMEVEDPYTIREGLTDSVASALPGYVARAGGVLRGWLSRAPVRTAGRSAPIGSANRAMP
ncbi:MAG: hydrogenase maturation protease [Candidatus Sumerlaeaceae bacterium]|nr:hydrogenase maturation protease [Candidatus Sumerlaeaceae bacterium]